jgi:hypothetical protein
MPAIFSWQAFLIAAAPQPNVGALKMMKGASYEKPNNRASPVGNAPLSPPSAVLLHGKASHVIFRSLRSPTNPVPLPPRWGRF